MQSFDDMRRTLDRVEYKPGWSLRLFLDGERPCLQVRFKAADCETGNVEMQACRKWFLSPYMTVSELVGTAFKAFLTAEEHECREAFRYCGQRVLGPHIDLPTIAYLLEQGDLVEDVRE